VNVKDKYKNDSENIYNIWLKYTSADKLYACQNMSIDFRFGKHNTEFILQLKVL